MGGRGIACDPSSFFFILLHPSSFLSFSLLGERERKKRSKERKRENLQWGLFDGRRLLKRDKSYSRACAGVEEGGAGWCRGHVAMSSWVSPGKALRIGHVTFCVRGASKSRPGRPHDQQHSLKNLRSWAAGRARDDLARALARSRRYEAEQWRGEDGEAVAAAGSAA
jgi:hypothetical protein